MRWQPTKILGVRGQQDATVRPGGPAGSCQLHCVMTMVEKGPGGVDGELGSLMNPRALSVND